MNPEDLDALSSENQTSPVNDPVSIGTTGKDPDDPAHVITATIRTIARQNQGDAQRLLGLLRLLESLHREIEDGLFRQALPTNRQALYALLRDMENQGGWPYIPRLRLKQIMHWIEELEDPEEDPEEEPSKSD